MRMEDVCAHLHLLEAIENTLAKAVAPAPRATGSLVMSRSGGPILSSVYSHQPPEKSVDSVVLHPWKTERASRRRCPVITPLSGRTAVRRMQPARRYRSLVTTSLVLCG